MEKKELNFKPITDGLGFHPFSDGLPYAPVSKRSNEAPPAEPEIRLPLGMHSGAGAVAAGPVRVSPAITRPAPRVSVPVVAPPAIGPGSAAAAARPSTALPLASDETYGLGYLFKRIFAYLLDSALNSALLIAGLSFVLVREEMNPESLVSNGVLLMATLFLIFFNWALIVAQEVAFGTSVGKRVFGLTLQAPASAVFLRAFFFLPSVAFGGLGLAWALFNRRRRCWHDVVVDVQPAEVVRL
jgi:uncharacterized RDD family membrane protein YckC